MSEFCVSPLSNVVAGGGDPGRAANNLELPISRAIKSAPIGLIFLDIKLSRGQRPRLQSLIRQATAAIIFFSEKCRCSQKRGDLTRKSTKDCR